jgi:hypothetical protein
MAGRHVDDEPLHFAGGNLSDLVRHRVDVPVPLERRARAKQTEYIFDNMPVRLSAGDYSS